MSKASKPPRPKLCAEFLKQAAILIFLIVAIFVIDWKLAALSLVWCRWFSIRPSGSGRRLRVLSKSNQQEMADMANVLYETLAGNRIVKAFSMEKAEAGKFRKVTQRIFKLNLRQNMTHSALVAADGSLGRAGRGRISCSTPARRSSVSA